MAISRKNCFVEGAFIIYNSSVVAKLGQFFGDRRAKEKNIDLGPVFRFF